jgi:hypothetical protein
MYDVEAMHGGTDYVASAVAGKTRIDDAIADFDSCRQPVVRGVMAAQQLPAPNGTDLLERENACRRVSVERKALETGRRIEFCPGKNKEDEDDEDGQYRSRGARNRAARERYRPRLEVARVWMENGGQREEDPTVRTRDGERIRSEKAAGTRTGCQELVFFYYSVVYAAEAEKRAGADRGRRIRTLARGLGH